MSDNSSFWNVAEIVFTDTIGSPVSYGITLGGVSCCRNAIRVISWRTMPANSTISFQASGGSFFDLTIFIFSLFSWGQNSLFKSFAYKNLIGLLKGSNSWRPKVLKGQFFGHKEHFLWKMLFFFCNWISDFLRYFSKEKNNPVYLHPDLMSLENRTN